MDSDVERLATESIDRRRQATIAAAVEAAEAKLRAEHEAELQRVKEAHALELSAMQARVEAADVALTRLKREASEAREEGVRAAREESQRMESERNEMAKRSGATEERLRSTEAERAELERGILRARDIVAAKDVELREARAKAEQQLVEQLRVADAQREAAIDVTRREMEARLTRSEAESGAKLAALEEAHRKMEEYTAQVEEALVTARDLASHRETQLTELEASAAKAVVAAERRAGERAALTQAAAVRAAMDAAAKAQARAVAAAEQRGVRVGSTLGSIGHGGSGGHGSEVSAVDTSPAPDEHGPSEQPVVAMF